MAGALFAAPALASAQAIKPPPEMRHFTAEEIAAVEMPDLAFTETPDMAEDYDKYFYFHRDGTDFDTAFADISECDALASGISYYGGGDQSMTNYYVMQYGLAGAVGGAIGSAVADAIFGSAERRAIRRTNLRNCMGYKDYARYGMEREHWQAFNFEEGNGRVEGDKRLGYLMKQARVASGPKPQTEVLPK
jgi:hypothetical protein